MKNGTEIRHFLWSMAIEILVTESLRLIQYTSNQFHKNVPRAQLYIRHNFSHFPHKNVTAIKSLTIVQMGEAAFSQVLTHIDPQALNTSLGPQFSEPWGSCGYAPVKDSQSFKYVPLVIFVRATLGDIVRR